MCVGGGGGGGGGVLDDWTKVYCYYLRGEFGHTIACANQCLSCGFNSHV